MPLRADQISGFLPEKKPLNALRNLQAMGFNQALSEISPKELTLNMERLAKIVHDYMSKPRNVENTIKDFYTNCSIELSDTIKANEHTLIEMKKDK